MQTVSSLSDNELVGLLKESSRAAYTEIYNRYKGILFMHAYKRLQSRAEAEDTLQEIFTGLWVKREELTITSNLSGYLYSAVRNRILDYFSHQEVASRYISSFQGFLDKGEMQADHRVRENQLKVLIEKEIDNLPAKMREIFILSRKEHLSHKEIAGQLGISEKTVKNQINNALKTLRTKLGLLVFLYVLFIY
jgi:RNA polymerase sigma-70 factor (family 1)